jgi:hypothetical protein
MHILKMQLKSAEVRACAARENLSQPNVNSLVPYNTVAENWVSEQSWLL